MAKKEHKLYTRTHSGWPALGRRGGKRCWGGLREWGEGGKLANCLCAWPFVSLSSWGLEMFYNKFEERILGSSLLAVARHRYLWSKGTGRGHRWTWAPAYYLLTTQQTSLLPPSSPPHDSSSFYSYSFIHLDCQAASNHSAVFEFPRKALPDPIMLRQAAHAQALSCSAALALSLTLSPFV